MFFKIAVSFLITLTKTYKKLKPYKQLLTNDILVDRIVVMLKNKKKDMEIPAIFNKIYDDMKYNKIKTSIEKTIKDNQEIKKRSSNTDENYKNIMNKIKNNS